MDYTLSRSQSSRILFFRRTKSFIYESPVDCANNLIARIVAAADKMNSIPGVFERVRSHSFAIMICSMPPFVVTLNTYFEFFLMAINAFMH